MITLYQESSLYCASIHYSASSRYSAKSRHYWVDSVSKEKAKHRYQTLRVWSFEEEEVVEFVWLEGVEMKSHCRSMESVFVKGC